MKTNIEKRILELIDIINTADYNYHTLDNPTMSDYDYDMYLKELFELEEKYPQYKLSYSPTQKTGSTILSSFNKIKHKIPMISLGDVFNIEELKSFYNKIFVKYNNIEYISELKIDGLAVNLEYEKGILKYASTRGNGLIGEDVSSNVKTIKSIPLKLKKEIDILVRGEIFMPLSSFIKLNEERYNSNLELFANPRNAAAGSIRQLDSKIVAKRMLDSFIYTLVEPEKYNIHTQKDALLFLKDLGFKTNTNYIISNNIDELINSINQFDILRKDLNYATDGVVVKVNDFNLYSDIGSTAKYAKWAIAYKFKPQMEETKLLDVIFQVGRTGNITPVAILEPVFISGSCVRRATLHNFDYIKQKDIRINDYVFIHKAGEIIPEIISVNMEKRNNQTTFKMIDLCPICSTSLILENVDYFCPNISCPARNIFNILHFAQRDAMNIKQLGEAIITTFHSENILNNIVDIYKLKDHYDYLIEIPGFGKKSIDNILLSIEESKKNSFDRLFFGLGIKNVGKKVSQIICSNFLNIDNIINASIEDFENIKDIGYVIAKSIYDYFKDLNNLSTINYLKENNFILEMEKTNTKSNFFTNKTVVITGTLTNYNRSDLTRILQSYNCNVVSSVSSKTDYLILGIDPGSKYDKALKLNIEIIKEDMLEELLNE